MTRCFRVVDLRVSIFIFSLYFIVTQAGLCSLISASALTRTHIHDRIQPHCELTLGQKPVHQAYILVLYLSVQCTSPSILGRSWTQTFKPQGLTNQQVSLTKGASFQDKRAKSAESTNRSVLIAKNSNLIKGVGLDGTFKHIRENTHPRPIRSAETLGLE